MAKNNYEEKRLAAKTQLIKRCEQAGCGKEALLFVLNNSTRRLLLKPITTIIEDGCVFNLRYSPNFDTPFIEDQDKAMKPNTPHIEIEGGIRVRANQLGLAMFLFLHPQNSKKGAFVLENKTEKENDNIAEMELHLSTCEKIKFAQIDELRACYNVLTGYDPSGMLSTTLRSDLYTLTKKTPQRVLDAFDDQRTLIKFKLFSAIKEGFIIVSPDKLNLSWKGGNRIISVAPGEDIYNAFAQLCLSNEGMETYELLKKRLDNEKK